MGHTCIRYLPIIEYNVCEPGPSCVSFVLPPNETHDHAHGYRISTRVRCRIPGIRSHGILGHNRITTKIDYRSLVWRFVPRDACTWWQCPACSCLDFRPGR